MLKNFLIVAWRQLRRNPLFSTVNILGLALGMSCCFLILLFVRYEHSYDRFHPAVDRLFRVNYLAKFSSQELELTRIPAPVGPELAAYFPEVEAAARLYPRSISATLTGATADRQEVETAVFADSTFHSVFGPEFLAGDAATALDRPFSLVLTDATAIRFFGTTEVLGRTLRLAGEGPFTVTGVVRSFPDNAHIHFDLLAPYDNMLDVEPDHAREAVRQTITQNWLASHSYTYVRLRPAAPAAAVNAKFPDFIREYGNPDFRDKQNFALFPVRAIHLHSTAAGEPESPANRSLLYIFIAIGVATLLIAVINFINLSTASSLGRAREVSVRKVLGAGRGGLIGQFLGESFVLGLAAFLLSLVFTKLALPYLSLLTDRQITFTFVADWPVVLLFGAIFIVTGLLAGSYPAFFVSRFRPVLALKGQEPELMNSGVGLRKVLIGVQFLVAIALMGSTIVIFDQLQYLRNQPLGFQKELMLTVPLFSDNFNSVFAPGDEGLRQKMNAFEEELLKDTRIEAVTLSSQTPGFGGVSHPVTTDSITRQDNLFMANYAVDYDFAATYGLEIVAGRDFDRAFGSDHLDAFLINERAVATLGWLNAEAAVGKNITRGGKAGKVVGVVRDFNFAGLRNEIDPLILDVDVGTFTSFTIRLQNRDLPGAIDHIDAVWRQFFPEKVFEYRFLDESLQQAYVDESRLSSIIAYFAFLAIFISCFGLFGLVAYAIHQRTKEIGIRKVLGATGANILVLLSRDFVRLILIAGALALPMVYFVMKSWLADYAYHIELRWFQLLAPVLAVLGVALLTMGLLTLRATRINPVEALRDE